MLGQNKKVLTINKKCDTIKVQKGKEMTPMKYYEIKNRKTQETAQTTAKNFATACKANGWRPQDCKCIWAADPKNAGDPTNY
jgi:hypothetical protein